MKLFVRWEDVERFVDEACGKLKHKSFTGVYGLPRGGLVMAVMFSHRLHIPMLMGPTPGCLIVDEICDTGESLLHYAKNSSGERIEDYTIVTMYYKSNDLGVAPDIFGFIKGQDWIVFPWEEKEEL